MEILILGTRQSELSTRVTSVLVPVITESRVMRDQPIRGLCRGQSDQSEAWINEMIVTLSRARVADL